LTSISDLHLGGRKIYVAHDTLSIDDACVYEVFHEIFKEKDIFDL